MKMARGSGSATLLAHPTPSAGRGTATTRATLLAHPTPPAGRDTAKSLARAVLLASALLAPACGSDTPAAPMAAPSPATIDESALLDSTFRVDLDTVEVLYEIEPATRSVRASAAVGFRMRPGQTRPLIHLQAAASGALTGLRLDGAPLDPRSPADARVVTFSGSSQSALEIQRDLRDALPHQLELSYPLALTDAVGRFYANVNDIEGRGNETLLPTINTPHELARHVLTFRVLGAEPYVCLGSGLVTQMSDGEPQEWVLDTERAIASYTVLFFLAPAADSVVRERNVAGVDVRVLSPRGGPDPELAFAQMETWLPELAQAQGPLPMPRGLSIVLTPSGGGMEYFGGTVSSLRVLQHEIFHMYWGTSTVMRTYRDTWIDEAVDMWYELSKDPTFPPIDPAYRSNMVGSRSPIGVGFDTRAYSEGARVFQAVAQELGGREQAVAFLRHVHRTRQWDPFTTPELVEMLRAFSGVDMRARFEQWLYSSTAAAEPERLEELEVEHGWRHRVDLTPTDEVRRRHEREGR